MNKLIYVFCIAALMAACGVPKASITGIGYEDGKATVTGTLQVETPTNEEAEAKVADLTKGVFIYKHVKDSANVHFFDWKFTSPQLSQPK